MSIQQPRTGGINGKPPATVTIGFKWITVKGSHNEYCGRGSIFGNPYLITPTEPRDVVCDKYQIYFDKEMEDVTSKIYLGIQKLKQIYKTGKSINLQCYCYPKRCHCETIRNSILFK